MDAAAIYRKTSKGQAEIAQRTGQLDLRARRVLIMVDGKRRVAEISQALQSQDAPDFLEALESQGYVKRIDAAPDAEPPSPNWVHSMLRTGPPTALPAAPAAPTPSAAPHLRMTLPMAKERAAAELCEWLGDAQAAPLLPALEQAVDVEQFRAAMRAAEQAVSREFGPEAVHEFVRSLRGH